MRVGKFFSEGRFVAAVVLCAAAVTAQAQFTITHQYMNKDAQSLIGLPQGSHKTLIGQNGFLKWSQWSLKRKPLDVPIGFSQQFDGELAMEAYTDGGKTPLEVKSQELWHGKYPFIVSNGAAGDVKLQELSFATDPDWKAGTLPDTNSGKKGFDVVRLSFTNDGGKENVVVLKLSGKSRNLPGHVKGNALITKYGEDVMMVLNAGDAKQSEENDGLTLALTVTVPAKQSKKVWVELPYEWMAAKNGELSKDDGDALLNKAQGQWDDLWAQGTHVSYPQQELNDFYYSSLAYTLILTEYDGQGDLWALDGPAVYRQYWGRGEYFQARAMEVGGFLKAGRESVEHAFHIQNDDGEWDGPPTSGWPAWDNTGGNAAAVWDYYLFSGDKDWLAKAYPFLWKSSVWTDAHREETTYEGMDATTPHGARPIKRMLTGSKCRTEPTPELKPGEKPYWYGLLPWSYGDSGLPEGHSYSHNVLSNYGIQVTAQAAQVLGKPEDATWAKAANADFTKAIKDSMYRAVTLEKDKPAYLPAMPTYPQGAYSQSFLAIYPTELFAPNDPLVDGLITKMEREESQGLPTNVAWAGWAGVWPGESMNMAETYLLRGEKKKATDMLVAAMNHTYTTKVFKEEILTDITKERACSTPPNTKRGNGEGTGDQPEAWGNANLVLLVRDMLVAERHGKLHLLSGLPENWIPVGKTVEIHKAPVTTGGTTGLTLVHTSAKKMVLTVEPNGQTRDYVVHLPVDEISKIASVKVDGKTVATAAEVAVNGVSKTATIELELK